ncbi:MAG: LytTR family transcriptional regulator DNA-binding domain-containing protein [Flavobacteriaceae bacterium]
MKVHHSYIVQIRKIDKLEGNRIFIESYQIPVSRANKANLVNALA